MPLNSGPWDWLFKAFRFLLYPADHLNRVCWSRDWGLILRALTGGMYNQSNHTLIGTCTSLTGNWNKRFYGRKTCHWTVADQGSVKDHVWYVKVGNSVCMQIMMCVHVCVCVCYLLGESFVKGDVRYQDATVLQKSDDRNVISACDVWRSTDSDTQKHVRLDLRANPRAWTHTVIWLIFDLYEN